jgi:integrase
MPRAKLPPRVNGPYFHAGRKKWRIRIIDDTGRRDLWFDGEEEARCAMSTAGKKLTGRSRVLSDALKEYYDEKQLHGTAKPETCVHQLACLRLFFDGFLEDELAKLTPRSAEALYAAAVTRPSQKTGKPVSSATHHLYRNLAHGFFLWAVRKGYAAESPFRNVRPVGRPSTGKPQLTLDEAKRYRDTALRLYDEHYDVLALAAVVPLYLGLRASEVLSRKVKDLDGNGSMLRIDRGKTRNARRYLSVKAPALRTRLIRLAGGRPPDDFLFSMGTTSGPHSRQTLHSAVLRVCKAAGVTAVCPHSLRGLWATIGIESGAAETAVASALGHGSFEVTARHYAQPEAVTDARSDRVAGFLEADGPPEFLQSLSAESLARNLLAELPESTVAQLALILSKRPRGPIVA